MPREVYASSSSIIRACTWETLKANKALPIERPWADVLKTMAQPLYRHRFGT